MGASTNTTPAASNARRIFSKVRTETGGIPSAASQRAIVDAATPAARASCAAVRRNKALAILI
jgi:hypothetical protein